MKSPGFRDHFTSQAPSYARYRPRYPRELFAWLAAQSPARDLAIDVATGNGQAAVALAGYFDRVIATDASAAQLDEAQAAPRVHYRREPAERISIADASADLVVAAQAAHWFDWNAFAGEARRVLRPGGLLAIWCYGLAVITPAIDRLVEDFSRDVVGPWWPRERRHVDEGYRELRLPFRALAAPPFEMGADWDVSSMLGYIGTWSAVHRCRARVGRDPMTLLAPALAAAWGDLRRPIRWPLALRVCRA